MTIRGRIKCLPTVSESSNILEILMLFVTISIEFSSFVEIPSLDVGFSTWEEHCGNNFWFFQRVTNAALESLADGRLQIAEKKQR